MLQERQTINDPSPHGVLLRAGLAVLGGLIVFAGLGVARSYDQLRFNYLVFHAISESFGIVVSCGIFMIAWNARAFMQNKYFLFLGIGFSFVSGLMLLHMLAFKGMGVFEPHGKTPDLATQLWIASRYMLALSFLIAPLFLKRKLPVLLVFAAYCLVMVLAILSLFYWDNFPVCMVAGSDANGQAHYSLTPFKIYSEYVICGIFLAAMIGLLRNRHQFDRGVLCLVAGAILVNILSEACFTFYKDVTGWWNMLGHYFQILAFYLLYRAIIVTALARPYGLLFREQKLAQEERDRLIEALGKVRRVLEVRVQERTTDLSKTVDALQSEVQARVAAEDERRRLETEILRLTELERQTIGHELHDSLGQCLTGTAFLSRSLHDRLAAKSLAEAEAAAEIEQLLDSSVKMTRALARSLSPAGITAESLVAGLEEFAVDSQAVLGVRCTFTCNQQIRVNDVSQAMHLYRIAQEAVNNASRHGKARNIEMSLSKPDGHIILCIEDDGCGLPDAACSCSGQGMGMRIMNYRANSIGATLTVSNRPSGGVVVTCMLPTGPSAEKDKNGSQ